MMSRSLAVGAMIVLLASAAAAQTGNPGTGNPAGVTPAAPKAAPGVPAAHVPNTVDRIFVRQATLGGLAEVELGKLAAQNGTDAVRQFGDRMASDHTNANKQLATLAKAAGIAQPDALDPSHKDMHDRLSKVKGAEFDRAYINGQIADHLETVQLLEHEIGAGQDDALKRFASDTLPVVLGHLQMARDIQMQHATGRQPSGASERHGNTTPANVKHHQDATERQETEKLNCSNCKSSKGNEWRIITGPPLHGSAGG